MNPLLAGWQFAEYAAMRAVTMSMSAMPTPLALRTGEMLGEIVGRVIPGRISQAIENLRFAFPGLTQEDAREMALASCRHFGRAAIETALAPRLMRPSNWRERLVIRNDEPLRRVVDAGKGAILVTAHLGTWELFGLVLKYYGAAPHIVYRSMKNPHLDRYVYGFRTAFGQRMIERRGALGPLLRVLRRKGYIAFIADQHVRRGAVAVPFFGRPAATTAGPAALAVATGVPIVVGYGCRLPGEYRFEFLTEGPITARRTSDKAAEIRRITVEITSALERFIRRYPTQWLWFHRRWRPHVIEAAAQGESDVGSFDQSA